MRDCNSLWSSCRPGRVDDVGKVVPVRNPRRILFTRSPHFLGFSSRDAFAADPYGRNFLGTPPQGRADYAFWQHILASMDERDGRCAILVFGVLAWAGAAAVTGLLAVGLLI